MLHCFYGIYPIYRNAKDKNSYIIFCNTVVKSPQGKTTILIYTFFELKWFIYVEKSIPFSLFALFASDNLVHISPSIKDFSCTLNKSRELKILLVDATQSI